MDDIKKILEDNFAGFEVHLFDREKQLNRKELLEKRMPLPNCQPGIPKKNAWICWLCDENRSITDLQVYELDRNDPIRWKKTVDYVDRKTSEHNLIYRDCGCVNFEDWDDWTISDILFKFGLQYGFYDRNTMIRCLENLATIEEFKKPIENWLKLVK